MLRGYCLPVWPPSALALPAAAPRRLSWSGLTGALTGPPSSTYAPAVDALAHLYRPGQRGGRRQRHKINLILEDDGAQPSKAAANTKKLISQDNAVLMLNASLSSTYAPTIAESKNANVPRCSPSSVLPEERLPAGRALQFCTTGFAAQLRQPGNARFRQGDGKGPGQDRLLGHGDPAVPRRDRLCGRSCRRRWA